MATILQVVKHVTVFVLVFSVVSNLFARSKYIRYFRFVEGILLILLVMAPLFSWFTSDTFFEDCLEQNITRSESSFEEDELRMIGEQRDQMLKNGWQEEERERAHEER